MRPTIKAILIDPFLPSIHTVEIEKGNLQDIYNKLKCTCFDVVRLANGDAVYVDDEGTFDGHSENAEGNKVGFIIEGRHLFGRGLVIGTDKHGSSTNANSDRRFLALTVRGFIYPKKK